MDIKDRAAYESFKNKIKDYAKQHSWLQINDDQYITPTGNVVTVNPVSHCPRGEVTTVPRIAYPE